jgi:hypothetical protein
MKKVLVPIILFLVFSLQSQTQNQTDSLLLSLQDTTPKTSLLPSRMVFTQRFLWGGKGLMRTTGIMRLNEENRKTELKIRRGMLTAHQIMGYVTLAGMVAQGIVGQSLYNTLGGKVYVRGDTKGRSLNQIHQALAAGVDITYFTTAALSLFAPPPLINRKTKKLNSIQIHKYLAIVHFSAMLATNILASSARQNPTIRTYHLAAAYTAFTAFGLSVIVMKF